MVDSVAYREWKGTSTIWCRGNLQRLLFEDLNPPAGNLGDSHFSPREHRCPFSTAATTTSAYSSRVVDYRPVPKQCFLPPLSTIPNVSISGRYALATIVLRRPPLELSTIDPSSNAARSSRLSPLLELSSRPVLGSASLGGVSRGLASAPACSRSFLKAYSCLTRQGVLEGHG